jgi:hypothetical protein
MENDLKILKLEYFRNQWLDHTQILDLYLDGQIIFYKSLTRRRQPQNIKSGKSQQPLI